MIRKSSYTPLILTVLLAVPVPAEEPPPEGAVCSAGDPMIDLAVARAAFAQAARLAAEEGGNLWGMNLAGPMLFAQPADRRVVANAADRDGHLTEVDGVWVGTLPENIAIANTATEWDGRRWTMLVWPLPDDPLERGRLLAHEMFHRIQEEVGLPGRDPGNDHLATRDGRYWLRLEWRALRRALAGDPGERRRAVADALLFRARRRQLFPEGVASENALELNEGLAEYTGLRAGGRSPDEARDAAAEQLARRDMAADEGSLVRSFAYASGPAYGLLLDAAGIDWRRWLASDSDLGLLLAGAYDATPPDDLAPRAASRAEVYDGRSLAAVEDRRASEHSALQARLRAQFLEGPRLVLPVLADFNYTFDPNAAQVLAGVGNFFEKAAVRDSWGRLEVAGGGVLLERRERAITAVVVSAPASPDPRSVVGPGWTLRLADGWRLVPGPRPGDLQVAGPAEEGAPE